MLSTTVDISLIQDELDKMMSKYYGVKVSVLKERLGIQTNNKASFVELSKKMLNISSNQIELYNGRVDSVLKTVRITGMNKPAEAMSFMQVNFQEWLDAPSWHSSELYQYFRNKVLIFFIYQQYPSGKRVEDDEMTFFRVKAWRMSEYDLEHGLREVWAEVRRLLEESKLEITTVTQHSGRKINKNNLPSSKFNELGHLRPGGKNGDDKITLPDGQRLVRQRFWFNSGYVKEIIGM